MVATLFDADALNAVNEHFRDYSILSDQIAYNHSAGILIVPIAAPSWELGTSGDRVVGSRKPPITCWDLTFQRVESAEIRFSEPTEVTEFELGEVQWSLPNSVLLKAHFILSIYIQGQSLLIYLAQRNKSTQMTDLPE